LEWILVDRAGDLQSIFEKIRSIVRNLPHYLKPRGFKEHTTAKTTRNMDLTLTPKSYSKVPS
jgi:hypothetical protein